MADARTELAAAKKRYADYQAKGDSFGMEVENNNIVKWEQALKSAPYATNTTTNTSQPSSLLTDLGKSLVNAVNSYATGTPIQPQPQQPTNPLDIAPDPFKQAQNYTPPPEQPKTGLMWKENAPVSSAPSQPAPVVTQQPDPLTATIKELLSKIDASNQSYNDRINSQIENVNKILGPQNFSTILDQVMKSYQPVIDATKQQSATALEEANRITNIDAEKRGLFNSGIASTMVQKNITDNSNALAMALAELQKQAVANANDTVGKQLQGASLTGNMLSDAQKTGIDSLRTSIESAFSLDSAQSKAKELALSEKKMTWENTLAQQRLDNDYDIALKNIENDKNRTAIEKENLKIQQQRLALEGKQFNESIRQFNDEMALKKQVRIDDITKFNKQVSMSGAESKAAMLNAQANMLRAQIDEKKYLSDAELLNYQKSMDVYTKMSDGYKFVASMKDDILSGKMPYSDALAMIKPYEQLDKMYPGIYKEMTTTLNAYYTTKTDSDNINLRNNRDAAKTVQPGPAPVPTGSSGLLRTPVAAPTPIVKTTPAPYPYNK